MPVTLAFLPLHRHPSRVAARDAKADQPGGFLVHPGPRADCIAVRVVALKEEVALLLVAMLGAVVNQRRPPAGCVAAARPPELRGKGTIVDAEFGADRTG